MLQYKVLHLKQIMFCTKNAVFCYVAPCRSCVNRRFGGMYRLHLQDRTIRERGTSASMWLQTESPVENSVGGPQNWYRHCDPAENGTTAMQPVVRCYPGAYNAWCRVKFLKLLLLQIDQLFSYFLSITSRYSLQRSALNYPQSTVISQYQISHPYKAASKIIVCIF
jgi:hypothetical protein